MFQTFSLLFIIVIVGGLVEHNYFGITVLFLKEKSGMHVGRI